MATFYEEMAAVAQDLLAPESEGGFGKSSAAIRRTTTTGGSPSNPTQITTDYACDVVVTKYSVMERQSSLIHATDRKVVISTKGLTITPTNADRLVIDGKACEIVQIDPVEPGDTTLIYTAQVRF